MALIGDISGASRRERMLAWTQFTSGPSRIVRTADEEADAEETTVAELQDALWRFPEDGYLGSLIEDLLD